jgi:hypothetical protein
MRFRFGIGVAALAVIASCTADARQPDGGDTMDAGECAPPTSDGCSAGCWAFMGQRIDLDAGCAGELEPMLCMIEPGLKLPLASCYEEGATGEQWQASYTIPYFDEPGWSPCEGRVGSLPACE